MADWLDEISKANSQQAEPKTNWANALIDGEGLLPANVSIGGQAPTSELVQTGKRDTGAIDTVTGEYATEPIQTTEKHADIGTMIKANFVDAIENKIGIYAKGRGVSSDKYGIIDGEIVFRGKDGHLHYEIAQDFRGKALKGLVQNVTDPEMIMGMMGGATLNPALAALFAAGGRGIKETIGELFFGEEESITERLTSMGVSAGAAALGQKVLGGIPLKARSLIVGGRKGSRLATAAGEDLAGIDAGELKAIKALADKWEIKLFAPQVTKSKQIIAHFDLLGDLPVSSNKIGKAKLKQYHEINEAVKKWMGQFAPETVTPEIAGAKAVAATKKAIKSTIDIRRAKAAPEYKKAFAADSFVNINPAIEEIETLVSKTVKGDPSWAVLQRIKKMIKSSEGNLEKLHRVKTRGIDAVLNKAKADRTIRREMKLVKDKLVKSMDRASPVDSEGKSIYQKARKIFESESKIVEEVAGKKGIVGRLAALEGDTIENASKLVLDPAKSSPEIVKRVMPKIIKHGGQDAWNALIKVRIRDVFTKVAKEEGANITGALQKKLYENLPQRELLESAMGKAQKESFRGLMKLFDHLSVIPGIQKAAKMSEAKFMEEAAGAVGKPLRAIAHPLYTWKRLGVQLRTGFATRRWRNKLVDAMLSEKATAQLGRIAALSPKTEAFVRAVGTFLALVGKGEYSEETEIEGKKSKIPPQISVQSDKALKTLREATQ